MIDQNERIPPQSLEVERTVLGTFIVKPSLLSDYIDIFPETALYSTPNRKIYSCMISMVKKDIPIDIVTLVEELKNINQLDEVGGYEYIGEIAESLCTSGNLPQYIKTLVEKDIYRETDFFCNNLSGISLNEKTSPEEIISIIEKFQSKIEKKYDLVNIKRKRTGTVARFEQFKDRIIKYKDEGFQNIGVSPGVNWKKLTQHYRPAKGTLNIFTGIPGHGKSEFVDALMINLAVEKGWKWAIFTPENYPIELYAQKLSEKYIGKRFFDFTSHELDASLQFINEMFYILEPDEDNIKIDPVFKLFNEAIDNYGVDGCVLDPWNEMETIPEGNETLTAFIGRKLGKIRRFARTHNIFQAIVAHPTKIWKDPKTKKYLVPRLYDISDSSNWFNKADNGITIYRDFQTGKTDVHIQKIKFKVHGKVGCVTFTYDKVSGRYTEYDDTAFDNVDDPQPDLFYQD